MTPFPCLDTPGRVEEAPTWPEYEIVNRSYYTGAEGFSIHKKETIFLGEGDRANAIVKDDISVKRTTLCLEGMLKQRDVGTCGAVNLKIFNPDGMQLNAVNPP